MPAADAMQPASIDRPIEGALGESIDREPGRPPGGHQAEGDVLRPDRGRVAGRPLTLRRALLRTGLVAAVVAGILALGAANGVGPLAGVTPPDQVTDPREILARSLQSVIDASSVHVDATISGHIPGPLVGRTFESMKLDGMAASLDARPQDARSHVAVRYRPLGISVESLTLWDTLSYRNAGGAWTQGSLGSLVGDTGVDLDPLTLVDRLRDWLASPGAPTPTAASVTCDAPSGRCRQVHLTLGREVGDLLLRLLPDGRAVDVGATTTDVLLLADATTLQPAHLIVTVRNATGSVLVTARVNASFWNWPSVIADPPSG